MTGIQNFTGQILSLTTYTPNVNIMSSHIIFHVYPTLESKIKFKFQLQPLHEHTPRNSTANVLSY